MIIRLGILAVVLSLPSFAISYLKPGESVPVSGCLSPPQAGVLVTFQTSTGGGGGHATTNHDPSSRPKGSFSGYGGSNTVDAYTGIDGCATVTWIAPIFSGYYDIFAYSSGGSDLVNLVVSSAANGGDLLLSVAYNPSEYKLDGMKDPHPDNHWGTASTIALLQYILSQFRQQTGLVPTVNDMSLVWGGKFDFVVGNSNYGCWTDIVNVCGHQEHRVGKNADISFNSLGTMTQRNLFYNIADLNGGSDGGPIIVHPDHFHLRFKY